MYNLESSNWIREPCTMLLKLKNSEQFAILYKMGTSFYKMEKPLYHCQTEYLQVRRQNCQQVCGELPKIPLKILQFDGKLSVKFRYKRFLLWKLSPSLFSLFHLRQIVNFTSYTSFYKYPLDSSSNTINLFHPLPFLADKPSIHPREKYTGMRGYALD